MSYDKHWVDADRIYRITRDFFGNNLQLSRVAPPIAPLLKQDFAEVEDSTRMLQTEVTLAVDENQFREERFVIADPNVFEFFNLEFVAGDPATALAGPLDFVLTERAAERYFGNEDPIGKTLNLMGQADVTVRAVIRDLPENTHMQFELMASIEAIPLMLGPNALESWGSNNYFTYIRLPAGYDPDNLESRFQRFPGPALECRRRVELRARPAAAARHPPDVETAMTSGAPTAASQRSTRSRRSRSWSC